MVRTRFAPSPTGYLHIGGVRTALFNWLFARQHGGQFILRIDDTDQQRNVDEALEPILNGFRWLGLDWDEGPDVGGDRGPYYQSQRGPKYQQAVETLLERGAAYYDFATPEEIAEEREAAQSEKRPFVYSRRYAAETAEAKARFESEGRAGVVRLKIPREGSCQFTDHVRGAMEVQWAGEQDHVIQRADGSCLYHLASVVDDHDMGITHVIRAEEHLSNTPRQIFIARGLGYELPEYAHLPYVAEPGSKNKLSKRKLDKYLKNAEFSKVNQHGLSIAERLGRATTSETFNPVIVDFYEQVGYLSEAVLNYLLLLGWSLDDKTEIFSRDAMIHDFSLERVNQSPASFDPAKLAAFQDRYMQQLDVSEKTRRMLPYLEQAGLVESPASETQQASLQQIVLAAGDRIKVFGDILDYADFFTSEADLTYDEKAFEKRLRKPAEAADLLRRFLDVLQETDPFDAPTLEQCLHAFVEAQGVKIGQMVHPLRVAVTGKAVGFGLFDTLAILGRDRCKARIVRSLERI
jgi:glutamyl-tRNA synthetase